MNTPESESPKVERIIPPFCCNCEHYMKEIGQQPPRCKISQMLDLVSGQKFYPACSDMRTPSAPCGTDGRLFKSKSKIVNPQDN